MVKIAVNAEQDVVMLRSSTLDCYLTGHTDRAVVDGKVCIARSSHSIILTWILATCTYMPFIVYRLCL